MRKYFVFFCIMAFSLFLATEVSVAGSNVLRVTTWGGNYKKTYERTVHLFEKENDAKVQWVVGSCDAFQVKARLGQVDVLTTDLVHSIDGEIEGLWAELDPIKIQNMKNLFNVAKHSKHTVFANVGDYVVAYNSKHIKPAPTSWDALWDPAYRNRVAMYYFLNSGTLSLMVLKAQQGGGGIESIDPGFNKLVDLHKSDNVIGMIKGESELVSLFQLEEAWIGMLCNGRIKNLWDKGADFVKIARPEEGTFAMITTLNVVKTAKNKDLAMKFINYALSPACQEAYAKYNLYSPTVKNAKIPSELKDVLISSESIDKLFIPDWIAVNKVKAKWAEQWDKTISR